MGNIFQKGKYASEGFIQKELLHKCKILQILTLLHKSLELVLFHTECVLYILHTVYSIKLLYYRERG